MKSFISKLALVFSTLCACYLDSYSQAPQQFNYQGVLRNSDGSPIANKTIRLRLSILDGSETGTTQYREERQVTTNLLGLYVVAIGGPGALNPSNRLADVNWSSGVKYLKVEVDMNGGTTFVSAGASQLLSVPYALYASNSAKPPVDSITIPNNSISSINIADGQVQNADIANASISVDKLTTGGAADGNKVYATDATGKPLLIPVTSFTTNVLPAGNIFVGNTTNQATPVPLSGDATLDNSGALIIKNAAITSSKIADGAVTENNIANQAITTNKLADGSIVTSKLASDAVESGNIIDGAVGTAKLADDGVTSAKLAAGSVTIAKLATAGAADANMLYTTNAAGVPTLSPAGNFASTALPSANIYVGNASGVATPVALSGDATISDGGALTIADGAVTSVKIADASVATAHLADGSVTSAKILDGAVGTAGLADNGVTSAKLAAGSVTIAKLATGGASDANMVYTTNAAGVPTLAPVGSFASTILPNSTIYVGNASGVATPVSLSGDATIANSGALTIANAAVTSAKIADATIATADLADGSVTSVKIADGTIAAADLASGSVTTSQILDGTIAAADLANSSVTVAKLATAGVADANRVYTTNATGVPTLSPIGSFASTALPSANIYVGNAGGVASAVSLSGDATISNSGALTITNAAVTSAKIADATIATADLADGSVTSAKIVDGTVAAADLANSSVTVAKLATAGAADANMVYTTNATGVPILTPAANFASTALPSTNIYVGNASGVAAPVALSGDATISNSGALTIANAAVTSAKIADATVATADLADGSVTSAKIVDGTVAAADLANSSVTVAKLATAGAADANMVYTTNATGVPILTPAANFASTALPSTNIYVGNASGVAAPVALSGDATISNSGALTITNAAVTSAKIADAGIATADLANSAVTDLKLSSSATTDADRAVGTNHIKSNAVTPAKITPGTANQVLTTNASGNTEWQSGGGLYVDLSSDQNTISGTKTFVDDDGFVARHSSATALPATGTIPATGAGSRMMWYPRKAAFRAGFVAGAAWDDVNIGNYSAAFGSNTTASGANSVAMGRSVTASGISAVALGDLVTASNNYAVSIGYSNTASDAYSVAIGNEISSGGNGSIGLGSNLRATGDQSTAMGIYASAEHLGSFVIGDRSTLALGTPVYVKSTSDNEMSTRFVGGYRFGTALNTATGDLTAGVTIAPATGLMSYMTDLTSSITAAGGDVLVNKAYVDSKSTPALTSGQILIGNAGNVATPVTPTGDVTISPAGAISINNGAVTNADIAPGTASQVLTTNAGGTTEWSTNLVGKTDGTSAIANYSATILAQTAAFTLDNSMNGKIITVTTSGAVNVTVPSTLSVGFNCMIVQLGAGQAIFTNGGNASVIISNRQSFTRTAGLNAIATVVAVAPNRFITSGDMQ